jgi:hypothetical protein
MTPAHAEAACLLADLRRQGFELSAEGDGVRVRPASLLPDGLRQAVGLHKAGLLALLRREATDPGQAPPLAPRPLAWDQAEADRLLAELRAAAHCVGRAAEAGRARPALAAVAALCLRLGEKFDREHELEAARGWDAMELLRDAAAQARRIAREVGLAPDAGPLPPASGQSVQSGQARQVGAASLFGQT